MCFRKQRNISRAPAAVHSNIAAEHMQRCAGICVCCKCGSSAASLPALQLGQHAAAAVRATSRLNSIAMFRWQETSILASGSAAHSGPPSENYRRMSGGFIRSRAAQNSARCVSDPPQPLRSPLHEPRSVKPSGHVTTLRRAPQGLRSPLHTDASDWPTAQQHTIPPSHVLFLCLENC